MEENRTRSLSKPKPRPRICVKRRLTNPFKLTKRGSVFARELMNSSRDIDRDFQQPPLLETRHPRAPPSKTSCPRPTTCRPFIYLSNNIFFKKDLENQHQGLSGSAIEYLIWGEESSLGEQAPAATWHRVTAEVISSGSIPVIKVDRFSPRKKRTIEYVSRVVWVISTPGFACRDYLPAFLYR